LIAVILELELYLPGRQSLKQKRQTLRSLKDRLSKRFGAAVAEVGDQELWQRGRLGVAVLGGDVAEVRQRAQDAVDWLRRRPDFEVLHVHQASVDPTAA